jgi:anti-anti-sigma factor
MSLYDVQTSDGALGPVVALSGEIDLAAVDAVEKKVRALVEGQPDVLVLDLRRVEFMDSSGLRLVLRLDQEQRERQGRLVLVRGGRRVARVLELTGADRQLEMVDDPAEIQG